VSLKRYAYRHGEWPQTLTRMGARTCLGTALREEYMNAFFDNDPSGKLAELFPGPSSS